MTDDFARRIRERFPEGLTGVLVIGGTRTHYILTRNRQSAEPGSIPNYDDYMDYALGLTLDLIQSFFDLGGENLIVALFSYQGFEERGPAYKAQAASMCLRVINEQALAFYRANDIDPYFAGIDTLLHLPPGTVERDLGEQFDQFHKTWDYQPGRRKIVWEVAPVPLFSFWQAAAVMPAEEREAVERTLAETDDMDVMYKTLYRYYARASYGTDIPMPHFYLGTNRNGDMKPRAMLPIALLCGGAFRFYYTPYPSLFITHETLQVILDDLAFGKPLRSMQADYKGQFSEELAEAEYARVLELSADPYSTVGLVRNTTVRD